jgi:hypothetical protein
MKILATVMITALSVLTASAQPQWRFIKAIPFPATDSSYVQPYLLTVTSAGRVYVISTTATNATARNAIWYADSNDSEMKKLVDFTLNGDADTLTGNIGQLRGIGSIGSDIIINASIPYQRTKPATVGVMYYYPTGDTMLVQKFGYYLPSQSGHGTFHHGVTLTRDTIAFAGVSAGAGVPGPRVRSYNFTNTITAPIKGAWSSESQLDPGGQQTGGVDVIRDIALRPNGDYADTNTVFYTSRNSAASTSTGGITAWQGGKQLAMGTYRGTRISDATGLLTFSSAVSYGITMDKDGLLWVAGIDSTKRWVKAFDVGGILAMETFDLPSVNNQDGFSADPNGAPMIAPTDVGLTPDGLTAYVSDAVAQKVFQFKYTTATTVESASQSPMDFALYQNYPNPFNPTTMIAFTLRSAGPVRLEVFNVIGQRVAALVDGDLSAGIHHRFFDGGGLASGAYTYTLTTREGVLSRTMMLVK